jgi:hypothetical protein
MLEFEELILSLSSVFEMHMIPHMTHSDLRLFAHVSKTTHSFVSKKFKKLSINSLCEKPSLLAWAWDNGCPFTRIIAGKIAENGNLQALQWLDKRMHFGMNYIGLSAGRGGHIHILKLSMQAWKREKFTYFSHFLIASIAIKYNHLHLLEWVEELNSIDCQELDIATTTNLGVCIGRGNLDMLKLIYKLCPMSHLHVSKWGRFVISDATHDGFLNIIIWGNNLGLYWDYEEIMNIAINGNHSHIVQWVLRNKQNQLNITNT